MASTKRPTFHFDKNLFKRSVAYNVRTMYRREMADATKQQVFQASAMALRDQIIDCWIRTQEAFEEENPKELVYLSMEFLMGRAFGNDAINLCAYKEVAEALGELGFDINAIEDEEPDPALGNGGLGRLAACFLDSLATLNYPAYGCGIRYHYGMFRQKIVNGYQVEEPDNWLKNGNPLEIKRPEYTQEIHFGGYVTSYQLPSGRTMYRQEGYQSVKAVPYDLPVIGYGNGFVDTLRIWDAEPMEEFRLDSFDKGDYSQAVADENFAKLITEVLYPCDDHYQGKELRLYVFQMNDTHPTLAVPELMRILLDEYALTWDEAWDVVTHCCAYTNHTIMAEALEKWPVDLFSRLLPRIYQIVEEINRRFLIEVHKKYDNTGVNVDEKIRKMAIIYDGQVRMANMAIIAGFSVNGVARLHTEILENRELHDFYEMFPEKFNNKTNGITQRRFLLHANPRLSDWITDKIGDGWITNLDELAKLKPLADDAGALDNFMEIKRENKVRLAEYIKIHNGVEVDPDSIFDVQVKRLHEYKRQFLNILHVMYLYNQLKKNPGMKMNKRTFIFGAKAAAGYRNAKLTIKLINSVADIVNSDPDIAGRIKVVFIEDYKVSNGEIIFAAADVSEQISTASKEASGTGNMKLMLNGAVTIGTLDGANVEMLDEVGKDNMFIFGLSSQEVMNYEKNGGYNPYDIFYNDANVHQVVTQLIDGTFSKGDTELFRPLYDSLLNPHDGSCADRYFILKDFESYADAQRRIDEAYSDKKRWAKMALLNTASAGKFSSDRTIREYVRDIWHLEQVFPKQEEVKKSVPKPAAEKKFGAEKDGTAKKQTAVRAETVKKQAAMKTGTVKKQTAAGKDER